MKKYRAVITDPTRVPSSCDDEIENDDFPTVYAWVRKKLADAGEGAFVAVYESRWQVVDIQRKRGDLVRAAAPPAGK